MKKSKTHKTILNLHTPLTRLPRLRNDIEIPRNSRHSHAQHDHREILSSTDARASAEGHEVLLHHREVGALRSRSR
jgi:hypothetical protein